MVRLNIFVLPCRGTPVFMRRTIELNVVHVVSKDVLERMRPPCGFTSATNYENGKLLSNGVLIGTANLLLTDQTHKALLSRFDCGASAKCTCGALKNAPHIILMLPRRFCRCTLGGAFVAPRQSRRTAWRSVRDFS